MSSFAERLIGAATLDIKTYEEVEQDPEALTQAMLVIVGSALSGGVPLMRFTGLRGLVMGTIIALVGWVIWAGIIFIVGTKVMPEPNTKSDLNELLRTIGFASSPGLLRILGVIPFLGWAIGLAISVWMLLTTVVAVRQALDYTSTGRAVVVCILGWIVMMVVSFFLTVSFGAAALAGLPG
jgi:hypothetical protein